MRVWLLIFASRCFNVGTGGKWELFCTRTVRNRWRRTNAVIDHPWPAGTGHGKQPGRGHGGDVVCTAGCVSAFHHPGGRLLGSKRPQYRADLGVREQSVKAVAGQQDNVTLAYIDRCAVDLDAVLNAQCACEHVPVGVGCRLLL